jgi:membrane protease YdiL (CAAX protease family)
VLFITFFVIAPLLVQLLFLLGYGITGADLGDTAKRLTDTDHVTPSSLAYLNVALAAAIPSAMFVQWLCHGLRPRWLGSVVPRIRWRWLVSCFGIAFLALAVTLFVSSLLPSGGDGTDTSNGLNSWTSTIRDFVLVILLLTPLQAAGEEYAFRGYLTQAFGGLFSRWGTWPSRIACVVFPAALFALAHGGQDAPIFFDRFAFGIVAGILVITTGGLEAGIAMHVLNNFLAFGLALAFSDMTTALNPTGGSWWNIPVTLTQSLVYLGLATWGARHRKLATTVDVGVVPEAGRGGHRAAVQSVLEAPKPRV